ncbi:efflux RND transporter periplasmic adaptor subunit [Candidatus Symbiobacter mobilis]|uniref:YknX-like C-terminal permuted SH3-like domain-containing protein n=1 Tax=Candidatus Symbiobacter mobilis CR TaxID=946483 RepID=U5N615_9BURK|nr:efflux RND transporter periplasmic adaptor subunit [Candidatus Symbiobacter mobilis]AGX86812.1 hypothetical protein Cenrod_0705 [Candidatus Symbiobacter mobilis CR]
MPHFFVPPGSAVAFLRSTQRAAAWAVVACTLAACGPGSGKPQSQPASAAQTVTVAQAVTQEWPRMVTAQGQVAAWQEAVLGARVTNLPLVAVLADVGDRVRKGQLLARFDDQTVRAELAQARAALAVAVANARLADANLARMQSLRQQGAVSAHALEQAQAQAQAAQAQQALAQAQVTSQDLRLQHCEVRAVDDGVVSSRAASLGLVAGPQGGTELFRLIRQGRLEWRGELNATQLAMVRPGQRVALTLADGSLAQGTVRQLAPSLDPATRLALAYVDLEPGSPARAAMYANATIEIGRSPALALPAEAVVLRDGRSSVFVVAEAGRVRQVPVETGRRENEHIEVIRGLQAGQKVVVRGAGFLSDGDLVREAQPAGGTR